MKKKKREEETGRGDSTAEDTRVPPRPDSPVFPVSVQQPFVIKGSISPASSPILEHEDPEPLHIKEEQEEFWTSQDGDNPTGLEEAHEITNLPFYTVIVKSEDEDDEEPQTSQHHQSTTEERAMAEDSASSSTTQIKTDSDGEVCGASEAAGKRHPGSHLQQNTVEKTSESPKTDDSYDWQEPLSDCGPETEYADSGWEDTSAPESGVNGLTHKENPNSGVGSNKRKKLCCCFDSGKGFHYEGCLQRRIMCPVGRRSSSCLVDKKCSAKEKIDFQIKINKQEKPLGCNVCSKRFTQQGDLKKHMRVHTGEKPFSCNVCGRRFTEQGNLKTHMRVHTGEKRFGCDVCGKRFIQQGDLKKHILVHTGEKRFVCDVCGKGFTQQGNLKTHMRVHAGDKRFACDVCDARFTEQGNLKTHMRIHTREKPYGCEICGNRFKRSSHLESHMRVHTGEKPFSCDVCGKRFNQQPNFTRHMRVHNGKK